MRLRWLVFFLLWPVTAWAQGFAGLGTDAEGFDVPQRGYAFQFPQDHGPHPRFRIEWWYVTATLTGADQQDYGIQWTLFRSALRPEDSDGWQSPQLWMAHAAVTSADQHLFAERLSRGGIGQAGVAAQPFSAWIDEWEMSGSDMDNMILRANGPDFSYDLSLRAAGPLVFHGDKGFSVKSADGQASHYYSQPAYQVTGTLRFPDREVEVTGEAWLDREWSSQPLSEDQSGWDWFSLSFEDGERLMAFRLRGTRGDFTAATWIGADGSTTALPDGAFSAEPLGESEVEGRDVPTRWRLTLPERGLDVEVAALNPQAWMGTSFAYWEGPVSVTGSHTGRGYLEMTGY